MTIHNDTVEPANAATKKFWFRPAFVIVLALALIAAGWTGARISVAGASQKQVTQDEAIAFVENLIDVSLTESPELVCIDSIFPNRCLKDYAENKDQTPKTQADVECAWQPKGSGGDWTVAVSGITADEKPFISYLVVTRESGSLVGSNNVYWLPFAAPANASGTHTTESGVVCK